MSYPPAFSIEPYKMLQMMRLIGGYEVQWEDIIACQCLVKLRLYDPDNVEHTSKPWLITLFVYCYHWQNGEIEPRDVQRIRWKTIVSTHCRKLSRYCSDYCPDGDMEKLPMFVVPMATKDSERLELFKPTRKCKDKRKRFCGATQETFTKERMKRWCVVPHDGLW
ncbi:hypothetical protein PHLGIDRAFT_198132 [Phlebiopsis gigantea 11061_1 CR5-6]|uniref:Uncharacterized protein n=1 Tax=Phlebiopsis gigantea (strain 11061_1 CR5-6) TaxID=745531 RepID=A0A0C3SER8_PHLG1|nr:hypothetical protein PHLGIDRAFT_198132 [Phlebiopsis gigantea 11061_1 CR5-6]